MAKIKRKRPKKKYSPLASLKKVWHANLANVWFTGGHCYEKAQYGGLYSSTEQGRDMEIDWLLRTPHKWQVIALAFNDNGDQRWVDHTVKPLTEPMTSQEMKKVMEPIIEQNASTCNPKFLVSPGYVAVPSHEVDLEASLQGFIDKFKADGAFDAEWCRTVWYLRGGNDEQRNGRVT